MAAATRTSLHGCSCMVQGLSDFSLSGPFLIFKEETDHTSAATCQVSLVWGRRGSSVLQLRLKHPLSNILDYRDSRLYLVTEFVLLENSVNPDVLYISSEASCTSGPSQDPQSKFSSVASGLPGWIDLATDDLRVSTRGLTNVWTLRGNRLENPLKVLERSKASKNAPSSRCLSLLMG